jgi:hypothetical protein
MHEPVVVQVPEGYIGDPDDPVCTPQLVGAERSAATVLRALLARSGA